MSTCHKHFLVSRSTLTYSSYQVQQAETAVRKDIIDEMQIKRTPTSVLADKTRAWGHYLDVPDAVRRLIRRDVAWRAEHGQPALDHYE